MTIQLELMYTFYSLNSKQKKDLLVECIFPITPKDSN